MDWRKMKNKKFFNLIILLTLLFIIIDLFPTYGAPDFRYTGSSPQHLIYNLGLPYALFIIDFKHSQFIFIGPFAYIILPVQISIIGLLALFHAIMKTRLVQNQVIDRSNLT